MTKEIADAVENLIMEGEYDAPQDIIATKRCQRCASIHLSENRRIK